MLFIYQTLQIIKFHLMTYIDYIMRQVTLDKTFLLYIIYVCNHPVFCE